MRNLLTLLLLLVLGTSASARGVYQTQDDFLAEVFAGAPPQAAVVWLRGEVKATAAAILGHDYPALRIRYWGKGKQTAWILEEIGKEKPITIGVVIEADRIVNVDILAFRESRGWEVRYPFFTDQFTGLRLTGDGGLNRPIDGITGATLSVRAVSRASALALYFHQQVATPYAQVAPQ